MKKIAALQKKYPKFVYERYFYKITKNDLKIYFDFSIKSSKISEKDILFHPEIIIKNVDKKRISLIGDRALNNLVFHLGLIELLSYWKAFCSQEIEIRAGYLDKNQIKWWKDLIIKGMGQFFYENKIDFTRPNFLKISSNPNVTRNVLVTLKKGLKDRVLVPIGGGKDSVVTLEILRKTEKERKTKKEIRCFSLNPTGAAKKIMKIARLPQSGAEATGGQARCKNPIIVERKIDKKLLELNQKGYLNGHTPFSAYLAFLSVLCAIVFDYKHIAFSQEKSADEGNLKYLGRVINHQYSKSFEFEKKFRNYSRKYLNKNINCFSFLRPLYEIQIAKIFSDFPQYFSAFLSCNEAQKTYSGTKKPTGKWCGNCPKCLFVFASLYPFVEEKKLIKIFKTNLFENKKLLPIMLELIGENKFKPFECVGTKKESLAAFYLSWRKYREQFSVRIPYLLKYFEKNILPRYPNIEKESKKIMNSWNNQHYLPKNLEKILFSAAAEKMSN